jgi:hypothetical protein
MAFAAKLLNYMAADDVFGTATFQWTQDLLVGTVPTLQSESTLAEKLTADIPTVYSISSERIGHQLASVGVNWIEK